MELPLDKALVASIHALAAINADLLIYIHAASIRSQYKRRTFKGFQAITAAITLIGDDHWHGLLTYRRGIVEYARPVGDNHSQASFLSYGVFVGFTQLVQSFPSSRPGTGLRTQYFLVKL